MIEIIKVLNGEPVMLADEKELQVPSFVSDPARNAKRLRRLMQEEEQRAAEEQPIVNKINMVAWSVACVVLGVILRMISL